jgi:hypothetical protein
MSADTAFSPRQCPACGHVNPQEASRCGHCQNPLASAGAITAAPPKPPGDPVQANPFQLPYAPLADYTRGFLVVFGVSLGLLTCGVGWLILVVLTPAILHLNQAVRAPNRGWPKLALDSLGLTATAAGLAIGFRLRGDQLRGRMLSNRDRRV